jgi:tRNA threonylcarbamoyladenosine biosynthesis protein TsaE
MSTPTYFTQPQLRAGVSYTMNDLSALVHSIRAQLEHSSIVALTGPLGSGKTTMVSSLLRSYGIAQEITSPTFTYVNVYHTQTGFTLYHFDLYRIESLDAFLYAGFDEYLYQPHSVAIIEWPEVVEPLLTHDVCHVALEYDTEIDARVVRIW